MNTGTIDKCGQLPVGHQKSMIVMNFHCTLLASENNLQQSMHVIQLDAKAKKCKLYMSCQPENSYTEVALFYELP